MRLRAQLICHLCQLLVRRRTINTLVEACNCSDVYLVGSAFRKSGKCLLCNRGVVISERGNFSVPVVLVGR